MQTCHLVDGNTLYRLVKQAGSEDGKRRGYKLLSRAHRRRTHIIPISAAPRRTRLLGSGTVDATGPVVCPSNSLKFSSNVEKATVPGRESDVNEKPDKVPSAGTS
jgi:hypothetical protein